jgi:hypothetical protein
MTTPTCCTGDCLQGRECPLRQRRKGWWPLIAVAAFCALLAALPAHAAFYTGNDWLRHYTSTQTHDQVAILAFTAGVADGHPNICIPAGVTLGQLADMVRDSLVALPAMRHHPAAAFVIATLEPVWPCKQAPARSAV